MGDVDIASLIVALTGLLALVVGHVQNKRGQKQQQAQQVTANTLQGQAQQFEQQGAIIADLRAELTRKDAAHATERARWETTHTEERARCTSARAELAATLALLSDVVRDEVAKAMVDTALDDSRRHDDHDHDD